MKYYKPYNLGEFTLFFMYFFFFCLKLTFHNFCLAFHRNFWNSSFIFSRGIEEE